MKTKKVEKVKLENLDPETITNLINQLKENWKEKKITLETVHIVLKEGMELLEQFNCTGEKKKEYVIIIVKTLVTELVENETDKKIILELIEKKILGNTIDLIVQASKGQLNINNKETQKKIISCTKSCIPILIDTVVRIIAALKRTNRTSRFNRSTTTQSSEVIVSSEINKPNELDEPKENIRL